MCACVYRCIYMYVCIINVYICSYRHIYKCIFKILKPVVRFLSTVGSTTHFCQTVNKHALPRLFSGKKMYRDLRVNAKIS